MLVINSFTLYSAYFCMAVPGAYFPTHPSLRGKLNPFSLRGYARHAA